MQNEVRCIKVPDSINELMDDILCRLRKKGIHISDRKYFNFAPIVQAAAYINGHSSVLPEDLAILKNYFWIAPQEIETISEVLTEVCNNPIKSKLTDILTMADEAADDYKANMDNKRAFGKVKNELLKLYTDLQTMLEQCTSDDDCASVNDTCAQLEKLSKGIYETKGYTVIPLREAYEQQM
jgi:MoxR-like ATPase